MNRPPFVPALALLAALGGTLAAPPAAHAAATPADATYNPNDYSYGYHLIQPYFIEGDDSFPSYPKGDNPTGRLLLINEYLLPTQSPLTLGPEARAQDVGLSQREVVFGTTEYGGNASGVLYAYDTGTQSYDVLHTFSFPNPITGINADGANPLSSLTYDDGVLYGDTEFGGQNGGGTIFSYDLHNDTFSSLYSGASLQSASFGQPIPTNTDGSGLSTELVLDNSLLYGVTQSGGSGGSGTLFSFDPTTDAYAALYNNPALSGPSTDLTVGPGGLLYGVHNGQVFSFNPATKALTPFAPTGSAYIYAGNVRLTLGNDGLFYGFTSDSGSGPSLFSFDPSTGQYALLGQLPPGGYGPLTADGGLLVGLAGEGGPNGTGEAFTYDPVTNTLTDIHDFAPLDANGNNADGYLQNGTVGALSVGPDGNFYGAAYNLGPGGGGTLFALVPQPAASAAVPEPAPLALLALGLLPLARLAVKRRRAA